MATFIILAQADRDHVLGPTLEPVQRTPTTATPDPVYILNTLVLGDPVHAEFWDYLGALPQMDITDPNFPPAIDPPDDE